METETQIYLEVVSALGQEGSLQSTEIGIRVDGGIVILTGYAGSSHERGAAEQIVKRIAGVKGVVNDIQVRPPDVRAPSDTHIARTALQALQRCVTMASDRVTFLVCGGWVTLEGEVERYDQCEDAEDLVRALAGVAGVTNLIVVKPRLEPDHIKIEIERAVASSARIRALRLDVEMHGCKVILRGQVSSWANRAEVWRVAWRTPGVTCVENLIEVADVRSTNSADLADQSDM